MVGTGIVRRIDDLGRIAIPREIRERLRITEGQALEVMVLENGIFLKKYEDKSYTDEDIELLNKAKDMLKVVFADKNIDKLFEKIL